MISQAIETQIYIRGVKLQNPRPPGMGNYQSHALTDRCDELLLKQRAQMRAMINQLQAAGVTIFERTMEYFEDYSGTIRDDWPLSATAVDNAAEGMTADLT